MAISGVASPVPQVIFWPKKCPPGPRLSAQQTRDFRHVLRFRQYFASQKVRFFVNHNGHQPTSGVYVGVVWQKNSWPEQNNYNVWRKQQINSSPTARASTMETKFIELSRFFCMRPYSEPPRTFSQQNPATCQQRIFQFARNLPGSKTFLEHFPRNLSQKNHPSQNPLVINKKPRNRNPRTCTPESALDGLWQDKTLGQIPSRKKKQSLMMLETSWRLLFNLLKAFEDLGSLYSAFFLQSIKGLASKSQRATESLIKVQCRQVSLLFACQIWWKSMASPYAGQIEAQNIDAEKPAIPNEPEQWKFDTFKWSHVAMVSMWDL